MWRRLCSGAWWPSRYSASGRASAGNSASSFLTKPSHCQDLLGAILRGPQLGLDKGLGFRLYKGL